MSRPTEVIVFIALFVLRLGIPVALTILVAYLLRRLDKKWEAEAQRAVVAATNPGPVAAPKQSRSLPCWLIKGCSEERARNCAAHANPNLPCWLARLRAEGRVPSLCATCDLFQTPALQNV